MVHNMKIRDKINKRNKNTVGVVGNFSKPENKEAIYEKLEKDVLKEEIITPIAQYRDMFQMDFHVLGTFKDMINKYRQISVYSEVMNGIDIIVNSMIMKQMNKPFKLYVDPDLDASVYNLLLDNFSNFLATQNINRTIKQLAEQWYIDGVLMLWVVKQDDMSYDYIVLDPMNLELTIDSAGKKTWILRNMRVEQGGIGQSFMMYSQPYFSQLASSIEIPYDDVRQYYSGKMRNGMPIGYLHKALKAANQLNLLKDALIIYRLSRAPERLIFYVDVAGMNKENSEKMLKELMNKYRTSKFYNASTGQIDSKSAILSMMENYWFSRQTNKNTEVSSIGGNINLGDIEDFKVFRSELYGTMNIPKSRWADENGTAIEFVNGVQSVTPEEKYFYQLISVLREAFSDVYLDMYRDFLIQNRIFDDDEQFDRLRNFMMLMFFNDIDLDKAMRYAELKAQIDLLTAMKDFMGPTKIPLFDSEYIFKTIFNMSDEEVRVRYNNIVKDIKDPLYNDAPEVDKLKEREPAKVEERPSDYVGMTIDPEKLLGQPQVITADDFTNKQMKGFIKGYDKAFTKFKKQTIHLPKTHEVPTEKSKLTS